VRGQKHTKITNREVLPNGFHLLTGVGVVHVGFPVGFDSLQRFSKHLEEHGIRNRLKPGTLFFVSNSHISYIDSTPPSPSLLLFSFALNEKTQLQIKRRFLKRVKMNCA